jgi:hypothetical protein
MTRSVVGEREILREHVTTSRGGGFFFGNAHSSVSTSTQHVTERGIARCVSSRGRSATTPVGAQSAVLASQPEWRRVQLRIA